MKLALSLSGGGYRAAAFHLGTMDMLHRVGLLERVRAMSTVSGGSIVGAAWALELTKPRASREGFQTFATRFTKCLEINLLDEAFVRLADGGRTTGRPRKLITQLAELYDEKFFSQDHRVEDLAHCEGLPEIIFNCTEFSSGRVFRFQTTATEGRSGNKFHPVGKSEVGDCRIADVVAASSCFPAVFEPIVYPDDFAGIGRSGGEGSIELMDGGVADNQGIDSLLLLARRKTANADGPPFDLLVISDSDRLTDVGPHTPAMGRNRVDLPIWLGVVVWGLIAALAVLVLAYSGMAASGVEFQGPMAWIAPVGAAALALLVLLGQSALSTMVWRNLGARLQRERGRRLRRAFRRLGVRHLAFLLAARINSVLAMATHIFMARIRSLGYRRPFVEFGEDVDDELRGRFDTLACLIYELPTRSQGPEWLEHRGLQWPAEAAMTRLRRAMETGTKLWWDETDAGTAELRFAGKAACCLSLLEYMHQQHEDPARSPDAVAWHICAAQWRKMFGGRRLAETEPELPARGA